MTSKTTTAGPTPAGRPFSTCSRVYQAWGAGDVEAFVADYTEDDVASERLVRATWVLVRRDGGWRIASYHNSPAS